MLNRYRGALLGLAIGDAVGTTVEFSPPGTFKPVTDLVGGGPFDLKAGEWTDDTSMALCLGESLVEKSRFDPLDQMERYVRWYREGYLSSNGQCFDIGGTVSGALHRFLKSGDPNSGSTHPRSAGNGSIMRLAPVPMFFGDSAAEAIDRSGQSSLTTHGVRLAVDGCRLLGGLLFGALHGVEKAALLMPLYSPRDDQWQERPLAPEMKAIALGSYKRREPPAIRGTGYVVDSLEAALWAFYKSSSFSHGCLLAANLGDDADTTAAVYGQIAGAYYGKNGIPEQWLAKLAMRSFIERLSERLYQEAMRRRGRYPSGTID
jgi:ADP-ribosylglycohydrolase